MNRQSFINSILEALFSCFGRRLPIRLLVGAGLFCAGFYAWAAMLEPVRAFRVVVPGHLYQSAQPKPANLRRCIEKYGLRAILNLRTRNKKWEEEIARGAGVKFLHLQIDAGRYLPEETFDKLYRVLSDESNYPLLVHCHAGRNRASIVTAFHRVVFENWPLESAIDEMAQKGFDREKYDLALQSLRDFCRVRKTAAARRADESEELVRTASNAE